MHVVREVEHEGSEGGLVVVENLRGGTRWPVEGESVRMSHMSGVFGQCQLIKTEESPMQNVERSLKYVLPILLSMAKHAPEEGTRKQTQALEFLQPRDIRQRFTQLLRPTYLA